MGNKRYKAAAFFVCCDDEIRESGSQEKAQKIYDFCAENGWTPISMKNDWLTVFGEGVTRKCRRRERIPIKRRTIKSPGENVLPGTFLPPEGRMII